MKKKRYLLCAAVLSIGLLSGCSSTKDAENGTEAVTETGTESGAETAAEVTYLKDLDVDKYVALGEYKGIAVSVAAVTVDQATVESYVNQIYNGSITAEAGGITNRTVEEGDTVNIDYSGTKDGVAFDGGTAAGQLLTIGSGQFIDGFEEGLIGVAPGETADLNLTFPENYSNTDLAGADVVFTVTVNFILPAEMSDEVVASFGSVEYATLEELNQYVYDNLSESALSSYDSNVENAVLKQFMNNCTFIEIPADMVEQYGNNMRINIESAAAQLGTDADTYTYYYYGTDLETLIAEYAEESAKQSIAFQAAANAEDLNMSDEELEEVLQENADAYGYTIDEYLGQGSREDYREYYMYNKVMTFLIDNAVITTL